MKLLCVTVLFSLLALAISMNVTWGIVDYRDRILDARDIKKGSSWLQVNTMNVTFGPYYRNISWIRVTDRVPKNKGATATLGFGGPGRNSTSIRFKSQRGEKIDSFVEIFTRFY
jgi:hypothetical protein